MSTIPAALSVYRSLSCILRGLALSQGAAAADGGIAVGAVAAVHGGAVHIAVGDGGPHGGGGSGVAGEPPAGGAHVAGLNRLGAFRTENSTEIAGAENPAGVFAAEQVLQTGLEAGREKRDEFQGENIADLEGVVILVIDDHKAPAHGVENPHPADDRGYADEEIGHDEFSQVLRQKLLHGALHTRRIKLAGGFRRYVDSAILLNGVEIDGGGAVRIKLGHKMGLLSQENM